MPSVLIGADICPIEGNKPFFESGDVERLFHDLLPEMQKADLRVANLECPLVEEPSPIPKTGPTFGEPSACINGIQAAGFDVVSLANNHCLDQGATGLANTIEVCRRQGIDTVGAGENLAAARRILVKEVKGLRIGFLAVAEHEFSIASKHSAGASPLDVPDIVRNIRENRSSFDYLIVLFHGSDEFFVPTPRTRDTCRFMIEMGANAVIVQHPHVLGGWEQYRGGHIVYGQGALIMDEAIYRNLASFHEGFLVKLSIGPDADASMDIVPFIQSSPAPGARRMGAVQDQELRSRLAQRSARLLDDGFVESEWLKFCDERKHDYVNGLLGHNRVVSKLNSGGWLSGLLCSRRALLGVRNRVLCETHREAIETIFNEHLL